MHHVWGLVSPVNKLTVLLFTECLCKTWLVVGDRWSVHVCALLPGFHWSLWCLTWNNGKLLTQASLVNGVRRLDHCDVIASLAPRAKQSWHSKPNVIHGNSLGPNTSCVLHCIECMDIKLSGSVYVPYLIPFMRLQLLKYGGSDNVQ